MNTRYISLKSVLYDLSTVLPEESWNDIYMYEWAAKAVRKIAPESLLQDKVCITRITDHKAILPSDLKFVTMIVFKILDTDADFAAELKRLTNLEYPDDNPALVHMSNPEGIINQAQDLLLRFNTYRPLRRSSTPFMKAIHLDEEFFVCPECSYEYVINPDNTITSTLKDGIIIIAYKAYVNNKGDILIPDDEDLKEAIFHYCMYRYYLVKSVKHEENSRQDRDWHLQRYNTLSMKAKSLNLPDLDTMENMANSESRLVPRAHRYDFLFTNLGYKERGG